MKFDFTEFDYRFSTSEELKVVLSQLESIGESIYITNNNPQAQMKLIFSEALYRSIAIFFKKNRIDEKNRKIIQQFIVEMTNYLKKIPKIAIYVAFEPKITQIERLVSWFELNTKSAPVCEFIVEPNLIGGAILEYQGKHGDYSLKKLYEKI